MDLTLIVGVLLGVAALWVVLLAMFWLLRPRDVPARELIRLVPDVVRLLRSVIADRSMPIDVRLIVIGLFAWILSPIDVIPEFVPVIGPLDDVVVAIVALRYVRRRLGRDELRTRWPGTEAGFELLSRVLG